MGLARVAVGAAMFVAMGKDPLAVRESGPKADWILGKCSWFKANERSALMPEGERGRRRVLYVACRWDYAALAKHWGIPRGKVKAFLRDCCYVEIKNVATGEYEIAAPADWGPARWTSRGIDMSRELMTRLNLETDQSVRFRLRVIGDSADDWKPQRASVRIPALK